jgi:hypothetical protein
MVTINETGQVYNTFQSLGTGWSGNVSDTRGWLASFWTHDFSGWKNEDIVRYDNFGGADAATGLRDKLISQPPNTMLVLSTRDEPFTNFGAFSGELAANWGATEITGLEYRGAYTLIASKGHGKIYEQITGSGSGVGFAGWIKSRDYETGLYWEQYNAYFSDNIPSISSMTVTGSGYSQGADWATWPTGTTYQTVGFYKTVGAGTYSFKLISDDASYFWIGEEATSGYTTGNSNIDLGGSHAPLTGYYTGELSGNMFYPIRIIFGNNTGGGLLTFSAKYENDLYAEDLEGSVYNINYQTTPEYMKQ